MIVFKKTENGLENGIITKVLYLTRTSSCGTGLFFTCVCGHLYLNNLGLKSDPHDANERWSRQRKCANAWKKNCNSVYILYINLNIFIYIFNKKYTYPYCCYCFRYFNVDEFLPFFYTIVVIYVLSYFYFLSLFE